jgi:hypothetical protein
MMKPRFAIDYDKKRSIHNSEATLIVPLVRIECKSFYFSGSLGKEMGNCGTGGDRVYLTFLSQMLNLFFIRPT